jgi:hypothetical protein
MMSIIAGLDRDGGFDRDNALISTTALSQQPSDNQEQPFVSV